MHSSGIKQVQVCMSSSSMSGPNSAVAEPPRTPVSFDEIRKAEYQNWSENSTALKFFRDTNEDPPGVPNVEKVDLFPHSTVDILTLERPNGKGEAYNLVQPFHPWSWRAMLNGMDDPTLKYIVGDGIIGITCQPIKDTDDYKRCRAWREQGIRIPRGQEVLVWDFVVTQVSGKTICFHPNAKNKKVSVIDWEAPRWRHTGNPEDRGKSEGPGSYRKTKQQLYNREGSFKKGKGNGGRGNGVAAKSNTVQCNQSDRWPGWTWSDESGWMQQPNSHGGGDASSASNSIPPPRPKHPHDAPPTPKRLPNTIPPPPHPNYSIPPPPLGEPRSWRNMEGHQPVGVDIMRIPEIMRIPKNETRPQAEERISLQLAIGESANEQEPREPCEMITCRQDYGNQIQCDGPKFKEPPTPKCMQPSAPKFKQPPAPKAKQQTVVTVHGDSSQGQPGTAAAPPPKPAPTPPPKPGTKRALATISENNPQEPPAPKPCRTCPGHDKAALLAHAAARVVEVYAKCQHTTPVAAAAAPPTPAPIQQHTPPPASAWPLLVLTEPSRGLNDTITFWCEEANHGDGGCVQQPLQHGSSNSSGMGLATAVQQQSDYWESLD